MNSSSLSIPICKYYPSTSPSTSANLPLSNPPPPPASTSSTARPRKKHLHLSPKVPRHLPHSLHSLYIRLFPPSSTRPVRPPHIQSSLRKHSYLHILLLPALLLLLLELPLPLFRTRSFLSDTPGQVFPVSSSIRDAPDVPPLSPLYHHPRNHNPVSATALSALPIARPLLPPLANAARRLAPSPARPGVSLVACCMNRHRTLRSVLRRWMLVKNISEILIVDWASAPPLRPVVDDVAAHDPRVRVLRVDAEPAWILSRAYNLAVRTASFESVIRTDCDYSLSSDFVAMHDLARGGVFYAGNYKHARNENEVHLNGAVVITRTDFLSVGGYDERIQTYGWDDEDLYTRLEQKGLRKRNINYDHVSHVPHDDMDRAQRDVKFVQVEIDLNALLLKHLPQWNTTLVDRNEWIVMPHHADDEENRYAVLTAVSKPRALKELVTPENLREAWNMALGQRLANDYQVPWDIMETMDVDSKRLLLTRLNGRMVHRSPNRPSRVLFAHLMHGLGNRLRALASAMSFAKETDRELVVVWETDAHIAAKFTDLFEDELVVMTRFKPKWPFRDYDKWDKAWLSFEFFNYMEMEGEGAVKGQLIMDQPDKHIYCKSAYVMEADEGLTSWDRDNAMLRSLKPVQAVVDMIKQHENEGLEEMIGIHIRDRTLERDIKNINFGTEYGDAASKEMEYWRRKSSYKTFIAEMHHQLGKDPTVRFYVATDTIEVMDKLEAEFPGKIVYTRRNCDGRDGYCVRFALVDVICLSRTRELIGSNWSSFTEAASRFGGKKARLAGKDFAVDSERHL